MTKWQEVRKLLPLCTYMKCSEQYQSVHSSHSILYSLVEKKGQVSWDEGVLFEICSKEILTQKSKLKINRTYFSNFRLLMPMLG